MAKAGIIHRPTSPIPAAARENQPKEAKRHWVTVIVSQRTADGELFTASARYIRHRFVVVGDRPLTINSQAASRRSRQTAGPLKMHITDAT